MIVQHTGKATLVALVGGVLEVLAELSEKKGTYLVIDDQIVERDTAGALHVVTIPA